METSKDSRDRLLAHSRVLHYSGTLDWSSSGNDLIRFSLPVVTWKFRIFHPTAC